MTQGTPFEVEKAVYDRAKALAKNKDAKRFYLAPEDRNNLFSESVRIGYGLYDDTVHEENGKYIVTYMMGSSCD